MRRPAWWDERAPSLAQRAALAPLGVLSWGYGAAAALHRAAHERGVVRPARLGCKVVSVGNLVVGGSGKTPLAAWLAAQLRARGRRVALASRGVGGAPRAAVHVASDGARALESVAVVGDEALLLAQLAPGVPVLVARERALAGRRAIAEFGAEVLVLDDGFQHHALARDVELVVFGSDGLGNGAVLPRGPLREPIGALSRAHAVLVTGGALPAGDEARIAWAAPRAAHFAVTRSPRELRPLGATGGAAEAATALAGRELGVLSALAHPRALRRTLESLGARVVAERVFADHHRYRAHDLSGIAAQAPLWVTSEKDALKLDPAWCAGADVRVLALATAAAEPEQFLTWIEARL
ncbi:MAG TPA: tetraacyldisaccharide 4'-kinase [Myxococcota bacterium]|jgi:tetraacyldisaccharide 4'-kinase